MKLPTILGLLAILSQSQAHISKNNSPSTTPLTTHEHWMHIATQALSDIKHTPCPFEAFGAAIVNHTTPQPSPLGALICIGANDVISGNPTLHGEIAAINNCTSVLKDPNGPFRKTEAEMQTVYRDLTLYTTAEPCAMCAAAIRWAGFKECVFGTEAGTLKEMGFGIIEMRTREVFERTQGWEVQTGLVGPVGEAETDPLFGWQFREEGKCPKGCERVGKGGCEVVEERVKEEL